MREIGVKALKNGLSGYLRDVAAGETLLVTDRGRVIAELSPVHDAGEDRAAREMAAMIREGVVRPPRRTTPPAHRSQPTMKLDELLRELDEDRADQF